MASHRISRLKTDVIGECIEKLHEKRRAVREEGMKALVAALKGFVPADEIDNRYFTVFDRCCNSIRKGGAAEATLAYRAIGLLALTVGACTDDILLKARPVLEKTLQAPSSGAATMVAALDCLAAVTLAGTRRSLDAAPALRAATGVIRRAGDDATASSTPPEVLTAALSAFALLLTTVGGDDLRTYPCVFKEAMVPFQDLVKLLESDNPSVVMAAGEAIAVCAELNLTKLASPEDMEAIETKVSDLATDASGDMTPTEQRQVDFFQKIADMMCQADDCPQTEGAMAASSPSVRRGVLRESTWARLVQFSFLRRFLGKGFPKHVQDNPLFGKEEDTSVADGDEELPAKKSWRHGGGKGKQWTSAMRRDRDIVWESKNGFYLYD
uniref:Uncharacterized protein n=1 Tax=Avena sativa TaxID=4498 RepID=A0ACD5YQ71_AVESA